MTLRSVLGSEATGSVPPDGPPAVAEPGHRIARDLLIALDGHELPCCTFTSAGARATIVAGELRFYAPAHWVDTVATPGGLMSGACVQELPNGAGVGRNGLATLPSGKSCLMLPCRTGIYEVVLTERYEGLGRSPDTADVLVSAGHFDWEQNNLLLRHFDGAADLGVSLSRDAVEVTASGHRYRFLAVAGR